MLDACVLYPTVMREMLLGAARQGLLVPRWSDRILEEWARAARKLGVEGETQARAEIALSQAAFPEASLPSAPYLEARLWLPDAGDIHVLATAISGSCDAVITLNAKDFPRGILAEEGLWRSDPDSLLVRLAHENPEALAQVGHDVLTTARRMSGQDWTLRGLLKKARLPRLGKLLGK